MKTLTMNSLPISKGYPIFSQNGSPDLAVRIQAVLPGFFELPAEVIHDDVFLIQDKLPLTPTRRLVVLVPPLEIDEKTLARRVWQLAVSSGLGVLFLALSPEDAQNAYQRRRLAILAAVTSDHQVTALASVSAEKTWTQALEPILRPGDLLVCLASHQVSENLFWRRGLGEQLAESAGVPVYLFGGFKIGSAPQWPQANNEFFTWAAWLILLAAFFVLQVWIDRAMDKPYSTILLIISVLLEVYCLLKVNDWIG